MHKRKPSPHSRNGNLEERRAWRDLQDGGFCVYVSMPENEFRALSGGGSDRKKYFR